MSEARRERLLSTYFYFLIPHQIREHEHSFAANHWIGYIAVKGNEDAGELPMPIIVRTARQGDAPECGRVTFQAFQALADQHGFPRDFPSVEAATSVVSMLMATPGFDDFVAEEHHRIVGVNFVDLRSRIAGVGPIAVDPKAQNRGIGRTLMQAVIDDATKQNVEGIRLVQAAYHNRSLCLYTRMGFQAREPLSVMQGPALNLRVPECHVRRAVKSDFEACNDICNIVHGFDRAVELKSAIDQNIATVAEHQGRITGYATTVGFVAHAVAQSNRDLQALIGFASTFPGPGFLVPTRNHEVLKWCLDNGLRLVMQMTLMSTGLYTEPTGAYLPSMWY
jgi:predicted N-acetyltransferase YhbS